MRAVLPPTGYPISYGDQCQRKRNQEKPENNEKEILPASVALHFTNGIQPQSSAQRNTVEKFHGGAGYLKRYVLAR